MAEVENILCPHCHAVSQQMNEFCESCGLAMPAMVPATPQFVKFRGNAATSVGKNLQADELLNTAQRAARSLRYIGIVYLIFGGLNIYLYNQMMARRAGSSNYVLHFQLITAGMLITGAIYFGMFFWAKVSPLWATSVGLGVYVLKWGADIYLDLYFNTTAGDTLARSGIFRLLMVAQLIAGIGAAVKHRKLIREQADEFSSPVIPVQ